jgi:hypothetical protein
MAYYPPSGRVLAFTTPSGGVANIWSWSGSAWESMPGQSPIWSFSVTAYDPARAALLFATPSVDATVFHLFDGVAWSKPFAPGFEHRAAVQVGTDPTGGRALLFGGALYGSTDNRVADPRVSDSSAPVVKAPVGWRCANGSGVQLRVPDPLPAGVTFEWLRGSQALIDGAQSDGSVVSGAQSAHLRITNSALAPTTAFAVRVNAACGSVNWDNQRVAAVCRADYDCDGGLFVGDLFTFLGLFFSGSPIANHDQVGTLPEVGDLFSFLADWFGGCSL